MKIQLVQIKDFDNISLENEIKSFFEDKKHEVIVKTFDLSAPEEIPKVLLNDSISIDYMIGVGLAGFFVLSETDSNARIVINPWMSPSQKLLKEEFISQDLLSTLQKMEVKTYDWVDAEMRVAAYGFFTHDADTFDKDLFLKIYGRDMAGMNNYSSSKGQTAALMQTELENALKYFEHIKGRDWQSLDFFKNHKHSLQIIIDRLSEGY